MQLKDMKVNVSMKMPNIGVFCICWAAIAAAATVTIAAEPSPARVLAELSGAWHCDGHFVSNGSPIASTLAFDWSEQAGALMLHHDDAPPNAYHAIELWTFDKTGGLSATIADGFSGVRRFVSPGWEGDVLTWTRLQDGRPAERFAYTRQGPGKMLVEWSVVSGWNHLSAGGYARLQTVEVLT